MIGIPELSMPYIIQAQIHSEFFTSVYDDIIDACIFAASSLKNKLLVHVGGMYRS